MGVLKEFGKLKSIVLRQLGREDFDKGTDGNYILSDGDKAALKGTFSDGFIAQFEQGLNMSVELAEQEMTAANAINQLKEDNSVQLKEMETKVTAAMKRAEEEAAKASKLEADKKALQETVEVLSSTRGDDDPEVIVVDKGAQPKGKTVWLGVKTNMKYFHNQMASEALQGNTGKLMMSSSGGFGNSQIPGMTGNTINVDEVYSEFGTYLSQLNAKLEILQTLTQKTESQMYMTTKQAITEWIASKAVITSVVQQFIAKWTPLGSSTFTPLKITNYRHKVNLPITPDDINDSWLSYLYDEQVTVDQMPVTRYILEKLLRPMIERDIEMSMIATGEFEALSNVNEGDAGQATGKSMDGFITILEKEKAIPTTSVNFYTLTQTETEIDEDNVVDEIEKFVDWVENIAPLYAKAGMNLFIDPVVYKKYKRKYRELYPTTKNDDKNDDAPDFSAIVFVPLNSMRGTGVFFCTPKENFVRLVHKNAAGGETKLFMQVENYTVKVFAEFWLGVGFALGELVFAYIPEAESGSGS